MIIIIDYYYLDAILNRILSQMLVQLLLKH